MNLIVVKASNNCFAAAAEERFGDRKKNVLESNLGQLVFRASLWGLFVLPL